MPRQAPLQGARERLGEALSAADARSDPLRSADITDRGRAAKL